MTLRISILALIVASFALALWLFANWYAWSMAGFDCVKGYWACRRDLAGPTALRIGVGVLGWALVAAPVLWLWKKI